MTGWRNSDRGKRLGGCTTNGTEMERSERLCTVCVVLLSTSARSIKTCGVSTGPLSELLRCASGGDKKEIRKNQLITHQAALRRDSPGKVISFATVTAIYCTSISRLGKRTNQRYWIRYWMARTKVYWMVKVNVLHGHSYMVVT